MNLTPELITTWGVMIVGAIGGWFTLNYKVERLQEKDIEQGRNIEAFWKWKDIHASESNSVREKLTSDISQLRGSLMVTNEQFKQIMTVLQDIKYRIAKIEDIK